MITIYVPKWKPCSIIFISCRFLSTAVLFGEKERLFSQNYSDDLNKPAWTPFKPLFKELKWLTFPDRCNCHAALLVYITLNDNAPSYMTEIISTANNATYHLRSQSHTYLSMSTRPNTNYMTDTFSYYNLNIWNNIPLKIRKITNEKKHIKNICSSCFVKPKYVFTVCFNFLIYRVHVCIYILSFWTNCVL